ncbi:MAG TPA: SUF system NifU family Fe-S cluster assembly protein [Bacteroidetes bacterium]|nr:MAG: SUF system NifU family Fe-S cluster assembly protein [Ignavibacteria bacterium GWA2_54_16]HCA81846.1 SUF system NifU family Fe-S cluster assembly protein [Bacteroidota bacterium]
MSDLRSLYQEIILEHNKSPRNFKKLDGANRILEGFNPLCGDHYTLYVKLEGDTIVDLAFQGAGCAISKASASVMTTLIKGKSVEEARAMFAMFHELVMGTLKDVSFDHLGKLAAFAGVSEFPARVKCASLAWHTMRNALDAGTGTVSTE